MITCEDISTGKVIKFDNTAAVLAEINRLRPAHRKPCSKNTWKVRLEEWTPFRLITTSQGRKQKKVV